MEIEIPEGLHRVKVVTTTVVYNLDGKRRKLGEKKVTVDYIDDNFYQMINKFYLKAVENMAADFPKL